MNSVGQVVGVNVAATLTYQMGGVREAKVSPSRSTGQWGGQPDSRGRGFGACRRYRLHRNRGSRHSRRHTRAVVRQTLPDTCATRAWWAAT